MAAVVRRPVGSRKLWPGQVFATAERVTKTALGDRALDVHEELRSAAGQSGGLHDGAERGELEAGGCFHSSILWFPCAGGSFLATQSRGAIFPPRF